MGYQFNPFTGNFDIVPDDAGGVATPPGGSNGQVQVNNNGAFGGLSTLTADASGNLSLSGRLTNSFNSASAAPAKHFTGTWITGAGTTNTKPHVLIEPAGTTSTAWSNSGTGLGVNAASGFAGNLLDLQVNGSSRLLINSNGVLTGGTATFGLDNSIGAWLRAGTAFQLSVDTAGIGFKAGISAPNTYLVPEANNLLAQRNSTNAQTFRVYNTFTSTTNHERGYLSWASNVFLLGTEKGSGGGTARALELQTDGATRIAISATGGIGFYGAAAAAQPTAVADATDASTVITQLNALLSRLRTIGLIAT